jgi:hypothetical protein
VAFVVCQWVGLQNGTASQDYIQLWHGDANLLRESLEAVQQAAAVILRGHRPQASGTRGSRIARLHLHRLVFRPDVYAESTNTYPKTLRGEKIMPSTQNAVNNHEYRGVPITALAESPTNPHKRFDAQSIQELAASLKTQGVRVPSRDSSGPATDGAK